MHNAVGASQHHAARHVCFSQWMRPSSWRSTRRSAFISLQPSSTARATSASPRRRAPRSLPCASQALCAVRCGGGTGCRADGAVGVATALLHGSFSVVPSFRSKPSTLNIARGKKRHPGLVQSRCRAIHPFSFCVSFFSFCLLLDMRSGLSTRLGRSTTTSHSRKQRPLPMAAMPLWTSQLTVMALVKAKGGDGGSVLQPQHQRQIWKTQWSCKLYRL